MTLSRTWPSKTATVVAAAALAVAGLTPVAGAAPSAELAPLLGSDRSGVVAGEYIVVLERSASASTATTSVDAARALGAKIDAVYSHALQGYAATLSDDALAAVRAMPEVAFVEANARFDLRDLASVGAAGTDTVQPDATWGIDRVDQRELPLDTKYRYTSTGKGVRAYVIDSGMRVGHDDFDGRAAYGWDVVGDDLEGPDCFGHGTHVGGTIGSETYGVAKDVKIISINTCEAGTTTPAYVMEAVDWVVENGRGPAVVNLSLGFPLGTGVAESIKGAIRTTGFTFVVAAGNSGGDACLNDPAVVKQAVTVGATDRTDRQAGFSDSGKCLDLYAPGVDILSLGHTSDTATRTMSGTSMASPHTAGAAALYLETHPDAKAKQVAKALRKTATKGELTALGPDSPNALLYTRSK